MPPVIKASDLPTLNSTRDGRKRIDLVTEDLFGFTDMRADYIEYQPGDTAAAHYHLGARHVWFIASGTGILHLNDEQYELGQGDVCTAGESEIHWFEATSAESFGFYEMWVPAPTDTVWVVPDDI